MKVTIDSNHVINHVRTAFKFFMAVWLRTQFFRDMTLHHWTG